MNKLDKCPVCKSGDFKLYLNCKDHTVSGEVFSIVDCNFCGFKFTNPRPIDSEIGNYYKSEDYISHSNTSKGLISKLYKLVRNYTLKGKLSLVSEHSKKGNLLDYGCGTGMFLSVAKSSTWNVYGIEPDFSAREYSKKENELVVYSDIEDANKALFDVKFNCITLWHVLEHVTDLNGTLNWFNKMLEADGTLIIAVPNYTSYDAQHYKEYWAAYDVPRHLYHFNQDSITALVKQYGFKHIKSLPMKFDSYYVSMLSEKYRAGSINYLKAFLSGFKSNLRAKRAQDHSSVIYVFKKA